MNIKAIFLMSVLMVGSFGNAHAGSKCEMDMSHMSHAAHMSPFTQSYMKAMCDMMEDMEKYPMNGDASHDFAASMIPHHKAAVDMALWDLKGRLLNLPLHRLLGSTGRTHVPVYGGAVAWQDDKRGVDQAQHQIGRAHV